MDGPSWTPFFQPPFDDNPINTMQTFDNHFDQAFDQTYDWAQAQWAPSGMSNVGQPEIEFDLSNSSARNGPSFRSTSETQCVTGHDSQIPQMGSSNFSSYPEISLNSVSQPFSNFTVHGTVCTRHGDSQAFDKAYEPLEALPNAETNTAEKFPDVLSEEYLSTLTPKQLEELKKKSTELLQKSHKKSQETTVTPTLQHQRPTKRAKPSGRAQKGSITCEHPGCTTNFSRKKDQNRHFRLKHGNPQSFRCPIINCWMGEGHEFQRSDKLRDHLNTKSLASATWQCIFSGCPETRVGKEGILDHLGTHELDTRVRERETLRAHGFLNTHSHYEKGYLQLKNICTIYSCPFGTNSDDVMKSHLLTPHEGPPCPCPITTCEKNFGDRNEVSTHLSREHNALTREYFENDLTDQGFWWRNAVFVCPICKFEIREEHHPCYIGRGKLRKHFKTHDFAIVAENHEILLQAFIFSFGRNTSYGEDISDSKIIKHMTGYTLETLSNAVGNRKYKALW